MAAFDEEWVHSVCSFCDPIFNAADVGFKRQEGVSKDGRVDALLWEADPSRFAARYPDSDIIESYGQTWPQVRCIDYWVYVEHDNQQVRLSVEGWNLPEIVLPFATSAKFHASDIAHTFARILGVKAQPEDWDW